MFFERVFSRAFARLNELVVASLCHQVFVIPKLSEHCGKSVEVPRERRIDLTQVCSDNTVVVVV